jgi:hypothetical protein
VAKEHYRDSTCNHPHKKNATKKRRFLNIQAELPGHELPWFEQQELNPTEIGWSARNPNNLNTQSWAEDQIERTRKMAALMSGET